MQQVASTMVTFFPPEVFKQREKVMNQAIEDNRICALEKAQSWHIAIQILCNPIFLKN